MSVDSWFRPSAHSKLDLRNNNLTSISSTQKDLNAFRPSQLSKGDILLFREKSWKKNCDLRSIYAIYKSFRSTNEAIHTTKNYFWSTYEAFEWSKNRFFRECILVQTRRWIKKVFTWLASFEQLIESKRTSCNTTIKTCI